MNRALPGQAALSDLRRHRLARTAAVAIVRDGERHRADHGNDAVDEVAKESVRDGRTGGEDRQSRATHPQNRRVVMMPVAEAKRDDAQGHDDDEHLHMQMTAGELREQR